MKRVIFLIAFVALFATGAQAQMVGATNNSSPGKTTSSYYRPTGHYLRVEAGYPNFISVAYGYQITPSFLIGAGGGFGMMNYDYSIHTHDYSNYYNRVGLGLPLFAEVIYSTRKKSVAFFVDYKIGANISLGDFYYSWNDTYYSYGTYYSYHAYEEKSGKVFYSALNFGLYLGNFGIYAGISTNSSVVVAGGVSYNIPLNVH